MDKKHSALVTRIIILSRSLLKMSALERIGISLLVIIPMTILLLVVIYVK